MKKPFKEPDYGLWEYLDAVLEAKKLEDYRRQSFKKLEGKAAHKLNRTLLDGKHQKHIAKRLVRLKKKGINNVH